MDGAKLESADVRAIMQAIGREAKAAATELATSSTEAKNAALTAAAAQLRKTTPHILEENAKDMAAAKDKGLSAAMLDRLLLTDDRIAAVARGLKAIASLPDPVGAIDREWDVPSGLHIQRVRVPLGVIGVIYESRPNVTADAGGLCLKAGNAAILRGGSESFHSSRAIVAALAHGLDAAGLPQAAIQLVPTTDRAAVGEMLGMTEFIDVIVPRGGKSLIERVSADSKVPLFKHLEGICHVYVDKAADTAKAEAIVLNAKMRRTGICGAAETLLVDEACDPGTMARLVRALIDAGCEVRGDSAARAADPRAKAASEEDWSTEYLDAVISVKQVAGVEGALEHIRTYGSEHTEAIVTEDAAAAERFLNACGSAIVMVNASTQFADGGEFGMGAEIGISTGKLHARGPVGVEQLTTMKYVVRGHGETRA